MTSSIVTWTAAAVLLFWAVGAYNRLMRLRGEAKAAFDLLGAEMQRQVELVTRELPSADASQPAPLGGEVPSLWAGLHAAAAQFAASLSAVKNRPLDAECIAALGAAQDVLVMAWERAERDDAHDLAGPRLPDTVLVRRQQIALQTHAATEQFNQAVARYNGAIAQFPALLLAWAFGFRAGRPLAQAMGPDLG